MLLLVPPLLHVRLYPRSTSSPNNIPMQGGIERARTSSCTPNPLLLGCPKNTRHSPRVAKGARVLGLGG